jgi:phage terminase Nu1 subunit (DNA packaging protein)
MAEWWELNKRQVAALVGVSEPTLAKWVNEGAPCLERGGPGKPARFDAREFVQWWASHKAPAAKGTSSENLDEREQRLDIEKKELENATRRGLLVERAAAVKVIRSLVTGLAAVLRTIPRRHGHRFIGIDTMAKAVDRLTLVVEEAIAELRTPDQWQVVIDAETTPADDEQVAAEFVVVDGAATPAAAVVRQP